MLIDDKSVMVFSHRDSFKPPISFPQSLDHKPDQVAQHAPPKYEI